MLSLADDSGLEIQALDGEPGVHTAVYFPGKRDEQIAQLLEKMKDIPDGSRQAQYRSVIAMYDPMNDRVRFAEGITRGVITREMHGNNGFGFDPVFLSDDLGKTFGGITTGSRLGCESSWPSSAKGAENFACRIRLKAINC